MRGLATGKLFMMASLAALIGGCSSPNVLFDRTGYTITSYGIDAPGLLETALTTRTVYQTKADALEDSNWWIDAPLFGAAVSMVSAVYYGASSDAIAGISIGAGTITSGRILLKPTSRATGYYAGAKAMRCVYTKGQPFTSAGTESTSNEANGGNLSYLVSGLGDAVLTLLPVLPVENQQNAAVYDNARKAYETAFAAGRNALTAARRQLSVAIEGVAVLRGALMEIEDKVKTLVRLQPLDFSNTVNAISASLTAAATQRADILKLRKDLAGVPKASAVGDVASSEDVDKIKIDSLKDATDIITGFADGVSNYPIDYLEAKTDVAQCATLLSSN